MSQVAELAAPPVVRGRWRPGAPGSPGSPGSVPTGETAEEADSAAQQAAGSALAAIDEDQVQLDWIKPAENGRDIVMRLFETAGAPASVTLRTAFPLEAVERTNLLEDAAPDLPSDQAAPPAGDPRTVTVRVGPFEIVTLRLIPRNLSPRPD
jgi:alpha-mannosidase